MRTFVLINQKKLKEPKPKLCKHCGNQFFPMRSFQTWCSSDCGFELAKKNKAKQVKKELAEMKIDTHSKEFKKALQNEINKLSKMIDIKFGYDTCIDCDKHLDIGKNQIDACHLISRKKNPTLRYHLANLHSGHNHCNIYNENHESNYKVGIVKRYGQEYLTFIESLSLMFPEIHLSNVEVHEKLKLVRSIIRNFDTYKFDNAISARNTLNNLIGIYKNNF